MRTPDNHRNLTSSDGGESFTLPGAELLYCANFLSHSEADASLLKLGVEVPWTQHRIRLVGRFIDSPRLSSWHGDAGARYRYSGSVYEPLGWTPTLGHLREMLQIKLNERFNSVLCNRYRDGRDSMGWHADDEPELGSTPVIASVSLGATRRFDLKRRDRVGRSVKLELTNGSLLVMRGATQSHWLHQLPKTNAEVGERINLTFRLIVKPSA